MGTLNFIPINIKDVDGGARRDRTADLLHAMQALSQLSYSPKKENRSVREGLFHCQVIFIFLLRSVLLPHLKELNLFNLSSARSSTSLANVN